MSPITIRPLDDNDKDWLPQFFIEYWGSDGVVSQGVIHYARDLQHGFVAMRHDVRVGLVTYEITGASCEIVSLNSVHQSIGVGTLLVEAVKNVAIQAQCKKIWLTTSNDNMNGLRFYQKRGFVLVAVYRNAVTEARKLKPEIPLIGDNGIPLRDEIELEMNIGEI
ncbi:MAG: GNAT family N-acetyltransferase [Ktedonobacteraceae bacterium]